MSKWILLSLFFMGAWNCPDEAGCQSCYKMGGAFFCKVCTDGYFDVRQKACNRVEPELAVPNCAVYEKILMTGEPFRRCALCKLGFGLQKHQCVPCQVPGCAKCHVANKCIACANGKTMSFTPKKIECSDQTTDIEHCELVEYPVEGLEGKCGKCRQGFALQAGKCVESEIVGCAELAVNSNSCQTCAEGFFIKSDGSCQANPVPVQEKPEEPVVQEERPEEEVEVEDEAVTKETTPLRDQSVVEERPLVAEPEKVVLETGLEEKKPEPIDEVPVVREEKEEHSRRSEEVVPKPAELSEEQLRKSEAGRKSQEVTVEALEKPDSSSPEHVEETKEDPIPERKSPLNLKWVFGSLIVAALVMGAAVVAIIAKNKRDHRQATPGVHVN